MEDNTTYDIDDLLVKYMLEEASPSERSQVQDWLQRSDANRKYFRDMELIWQESQKLALESKVDEDRAWMDFQSRIQVAEPAKVVHMPKQNGRRFLAAASMIGLVILSAIGYYIFQSNQAVIAKAGNNVLIDTLPDGSLVTLNKNASIEYTLNFAGSTRKIKLTGEAFFNVTPDKTKPFVINVNDVTVRVVGTSFNIKTVNGATEVIVETGIVEVERNGRKLLLKPKEKTIVEKNSINFQPDSVQGKLYQYYRSRVFVCDDTPLWQLVQTLNEAYNANIIIENKELRSLRLNTTFSEEQLDTILAVVATTLSITVEKKDNQIILK